MEKFHYTKRPQYKQFKKVEQSQAWFDVYDIGNDVVAIYEPYHFQEVISYLIKGKEKALLFDTGLGIGDMKECVEEIWDKDYIVVNSHLHFDHIGSDYQFDKVYVFDHPDMIRAVSEPLPQRYIDEDYIDEMYAIESPIKHFEYTYHPISFETFKEGHVFDLDERKLRVINTPGHTDDSIMLVCDDEKLLFTGDTYYPAPLYCFGDTFPTYIETMKRLKEEFSNYTLIASHNEPYRPGSVFADVLEGFEAVRDGKLSPVAEFGEREMFETEKFALIKKKEGI